MNYVRKSIYRSLILYIECANKFFPSFFRIQDFITLNQVQNSLIVSDR